MTRSFFLLRDASIVEIFSSEKTTTGLCAILHLFQQNLASLLPLWRLLLCKMVAFEKAKEDHIQAITNQPFH